MEFLTPGARPCNKRVGVREAGIYSVMDKKDPANSSGIFDKYLNMNVLLSVRAAGAPRLRLARHLLADNIQRSTCFKPFDLLLVISMLHLYHVPASISMIQCNG